MTDSRPSMMSQNLQLRDLRLLDPALATSYPSAILARDSALVVNLEFIKCIITTEYVLVLNPGARCDLRVPLSFGFPRAGESCSAVLLYA